MILGISIAIVVVGLVYFLFWNQIQLKRISHTIGWGPLQFLRYKQNLFANLHEWIEKNKSKVKPFYHIYLMHVPVFLARTPDAAKFVLTSKEKFPKARRAGGSNAVTQAFSNNLVISDGADWRRQRSLFNPAFRTEAYKNYFSVFSKMTEKVLDKLEVDVKSSTNANAVTYLQKFTLDVLGLAIFDYDFGSLDNKMNEYYESYKDILKLGQNPIRLLMPWIENIPIKPFNKSVKDIGLLLNLFNKMISERKADSKGKTDILTHFIQATDNDQGLTHDELIANTFVLFIAGHETTATALTWILYELYRNPKIQQKLYEEIVSHVGENKNPEFDDWDKLPYLNNFISENLRRHPPVPLLITRGAAEDINYDGVFIPKNSVVGLDIYNIHLDPNVWENPFEFNPDRFLPENKKKMDRFAYLPFSLGPRQCIGNTFSLIEQHLFVIRILQRFEILPPKNETNVVEKTSGGGFNCPAKLLISLKPRKT